MKVSNPVVAILEGFSLQVQRHYSRAKIRASQQMVFLKSVLHHENCRSKPSLASYRAQPQLLEALLLQCPICDRSIS